MNEEIIEDNFLEREEKMQVVDNCDRYISSLLVIGAIVGCFIIFLVGILIMVVKI